MKDTQVCEVLLQKNTKMEDTATVDVASIRCGLLVDGYMKKEYCKHENYDRFEKSLVGIIVKLLGNIFMIFDVYPSICKSMFADDGLTFKPDRILHKGLGDVTFGCSYGWNKGIYKISIQNKYKWEGQGIGITNNIQRFKEKPAWYGEFTSKDKQFLQYNLNSSILVGSGISTQYSLFSSNNGGDVITMQFDGDNGILTFLFNHKIIGKSIDVRKNEIYYPFISYNESYAAEFQLIHALE